MELGHAHAILTREEVARWLKVKPRQVERLRIPCIDLGRKTKRYLAQDVLDWLAEKRLSGGHPRDRSETARATASPPCRVTASHCRKNTLVLGARAPQFRGVRRTTLETQPR